MFKFGEESTQELDQYCPHHNGLLGMLFLELSLKAVHQHLKVASAIQKVAFAPKEVNPIELSFMGKRGQDPNYCISRLNRYADNEYAHCKDSSSESPRDSHINLQALNAASTTKSKADFLNRVGPRIDAILSNGCTPKSRSDHWSAFFKILPKKSRLLSDVIQYHDSTLNHLGNRTDRLGTVDTSKVFHGDELERAVVVSRKCHRNNCKPPFFWIRKTQAQAVADQLRVPSSNDLPTNCRNDGIMTGLALQGIKSRFRSAKQPKKKTNHYKGKDLTDNDSVSVVLAEGEEQGYLPEFDFVRCFFRLDDEPEVKKPDVKWKKEGLEGKLLQIASKWSKGNIPWAQVAEEMDDDRINDNMCKKKYQRLTSKAKK